MPLARPSPPRPRPSAPARTAALACAFAGVLAAGALPAAVVPPPPPGAHPCPAAWCAPTRPTPAESAAVAAESVRLLARYAGDPTALGTRCFALGAAMSAHAAADVRMVAFMWRAADADGNLGIVAGDAHAVEPAPGLGRVHVARGYDPLNPDRGPAALLQTVRHEYAHLAGAPQGGEWAADAAEQLATACGAP